MTKKEYIDQLSISLKKYEVADQEEIISEINTHFDEEKNNGKKIAQIIKKLGSPDTLAQTYLIDSDENEQSIGIQPKKSTARAVLVTLALAFLNFSIVIPLVFCIYAVLLSLLLSGGLGIFALINSLIFTSYQAAGSIYINSLIPSAAYILYILAIFLLSLSAVLFAVTGIKNFTIALVKYIKKNINLITQS